MQASDRLKSLVVFLIITLLTIVLVQQYEGSDPWKDMEQSIDVARPIFCEQMRFGSLIRQPANTWSNLAYVYVGILCMFWAFRDMQSEIKKNILMQYPSFSISFGMSCLFLGVTSFLFHASLTRVWQRLDMTAMYSTMVTMIMYQFFRIFPELPWKKQDGKFYSSESFFVFLNLITVILIYIVEGSLIAHVAFPSLMILLLTILAYLRKRSDTLIKTKLIILSFLSILTGFIFWILDVKKMVSSPESLFQGHALWHGFAALSLYLLYLYYRSEDKNVY